MIDSLIEQQRIQSLYNEYVADIRKLLIVMNTVLQLANLGFQIYSAASTLNLTSDSISMASTGTYTSGGGGGGGSGGSGGYGWGSIPGTRFPGTNISDTFKSTNDAKITATMMHFAQSIFAQNTTEQLLGQKVAMMNASMIALQIMNASNQIINQFAATPEMIQFTATLVDVKTEHQLQMAVNMISFFQLFVRNDDDEELGQQITVNLQIITHDTSTQTEEGTLKEHVEIVNRINTETNTP